VVQLHHHTDQIESAGASVVVIGNGRSNFVAGFRDKTGYAGDIYTDPKRVVYRALGLRRSIRSTFDPRGVPNAIAAYRSGARQTRTQGDPWQQGGVFVVGTSGQLHYQYKSRFAGDHPPIDDVIAALPR
jgi:hypothetical protein